MTGASRPGEAPRGSEIRRTLRIRTLPKTWLITGSSRGFGRVWAEAALSRGDRVVATARRPEALAELVERHEESQLLPLPLDVDDATSVEAAMATAAERFGRIDVVVNNAGYGIFGTVEE